MHKLLIERFFQGILLISIALPFSAFSQIGAETTSSPQYVRAVLAALSTPAPKQIPVPTIYKRQVTKPPAQPQRATALKLTNDATDALLLMDEENMETCGSGGCAFSLFGLNNGKYELWMEDGGSSVQAVNRFTNGHRDLVVRTGLFDVAVYKFNVLRYELAGCYDYDQTKNVLAPRTCVMPTFPQAAVPMAALEKNPRDPDALAKLGNFAYDREQYLIATNYYEQALRFQPDNRNVRTDLATAYFHLGEADHAITEFDKVLKADPTCANALFNLGLVKWYSKKDGKGAVAVWERLLASNPDYKERDSVRRLIAQAKAATTVRRAR